MAIPDYQTLMFWYRKVHDYTYKVFPYSEYDELHQNLNRESEVIPVVVKGLAANDLSHLPRAPIYSIEVLRRMKESGVSL